MPFGPAFDVGLGVDHQRVGLGRVGDPELGAVEHVAVALLVGAQLHADHVGARAGLAHRQRADVLAGNQFRQVFLLLFRRGPAADLVDAQVGMRAVGKPDGGRGARHLFHRDAVVQIAEAQPAPFLFDRDAVQAERAHLRPQLAREMLGAVDFRGERRDLGAGEFLRRLAYGDGGFVEADIGGRSMVEHGVDLVRVGGQCNSRILPRETGEGDRRAKRRWWRGRMRAKPNLTIRRARALRRTMTLPEVILWQHIRAGRLDGIVVPAPARVGAYILDFYCAAARLAG